MNITKHGYVNLGEGTVPGSRIYTYTFIVDGINIYVDNPSDLKSLELKINAEFGEISIVSYKHHNEISIIFTTKVEIVYNLVPPDLEVSIHRRLTECLKM